MAIIERCSDLQEQANFEIFPIKDLRETNGGAWHRVECFEREKK